MPDNTNLIKLFNKIALSVEFNDKFAIDNLKEKYKKIKDLTNIRVIQVVNEKLSIKDCLEYIEYIKKIGINQITFRQMFGNINAFNHFNKLKNHINNIHGVLFLKDGEYHNYYFTINNKLYPYFFGNTEHDREKWKTIYENIEQSCT